MLILVRRCEQSNVERFYRESQLATARVKLGVDAPKACKVLRSELPQ